MVSAPTFSSLEEMELSHWLADVRKRLTDNQWPSECVRCKVAEETGTQSIREMEQIQHEKLLLLHKDYLIVDVVITTECNAACQICRPVDSSFYAKVVNVEHKVFLGLVELEKIPPERIIQLDIIGGEPSVSQETRKFLATLNSSKLQTIRISTNGSSKIVELEPLLRNGKKINLSMSMDGTDRVFEYCRWPLKWSKFRATLEYYRELSSEYSNLNLSLWSAYSALSIGDLPNMIMFSESVGINFVGSAIVNPSVLQISNTNYLTVAAKEELLLSQHDYARKIANTVAIHPEDNSERLTRFIKKADLLRKINIKDYLGDIHHGTSI